jgi:hypothetical protein
MDRPEDVIKTPNQTIQPPKDAPHLTEKELSLIGQMQKLRTKAQQHAEWLMFQRVADKPRRITKPLTFNDKGEVVVCDGKESPVGNGNIRKGTLRNKKCSCGSGKKYKRCCLNKKNG